MSRPGHASGSTHPRSSLRGVGYRANMHDGRSAYLSRGQRLVRGVAAATALSFWLMSFLAPAHAEQDPGFVIELDRDQYQVQIHHVEGHHIEMLQTKIQIFL